VQDELERVQASSSRHQADVCQLGEQLHNLEQCNSEHLEALNHAQLGAQSVRADLEKFQSRAADAEATVAARTAALEEALDVVKTLTSEKEHLESQVCLFFFVILLRAGHNMSHTGQRCLIGRDITSSRATVQSFVNKPPSPTHLDTCLQECTSSASLMQNAFAIALLCSN
jgi:hypothetical protein